MQIKKIVASLAMLELASTSVLAAPAQVSLQDDTFWQSIIQHNQDNVGVPMLQTGQTKISGLFRTQLVNNSKRGVADNTTNGPYSKGSQNDKGSTLFSLRSSELYFDAQPANNVKVHFVMDYDDNFTNPQITYQTGGGISHNTNLFFPEANATLTYGNMWATFGREFSNFGSVKRYSTSVPLTEVLTTSNQTGIDLGYAMRSVGLYGDVFLYNGHGVGTSNSKVNDSKNNLHGYSAEIGYARNNGSNNWFGNNFLNIALSYINNVQDTMTMSTYIDTEATKEIRTPNERGVSFFRKSIPAYALHADYTQGAFSVLADYVLMDKLKGTGLYYGKTTDTQLKSPTPSAYSLQSVYAFTTAGQHNNYITLGYEGTQQALGITSFGGTFPLPEQRLLVNYKYDLMKNVSAEVEYDMDKDYAKRTVAYYDSGFAINPPTIQGTGQTNSVVTARLNVIF